MKTFNCALAVAFAFLAGTNLWAVPAGFNVQGRLTDANGVNKNGTFQIKFSVFATYVGGPPVWEKNMISPQVTVNNGNFQVILQGLGDNNVQLEAAVKDLEAAYVEIKVGNESPLVPRQLLLRSPFSPSGMLTGKTNVLIQSDSQNSSSGIIAMKTGINDRLTILNNGNMGIGTTGPTALLSVGSTAVNPSLNLFQFGYGQAKTDTALRRVGTLAQSNESSQPFAFHVSVAGAAADANRFAALQTGVEGLNSSGNLLLQPYGGNVGIGTVSTFTIPGGVQTPKLNVAGAIKFSPAGHAVMMTNVPGSPPGYLEYYIDGSLYGVSMWASSKRFKTDITELELDTGMIYDLRPVSFNWIAKRGGKRDFGLIAEEVEKVLPLLVHYDGEGKAFGVKYDLLSVLLLNALKQKNAEINILKGEMEQFKARLAKLEQSVR